MEPNIDGYERLTLIGRGGFASVYKAFEPTFGRWVALKIVDNAIADDAAKRDFERECQLVGRLTRHPNVVTVFGAGTTREGRSYLAMDLYDGGSLAEWLERHHTLTQQDTLRLGVKLAGAVESAHRSGSLHRDLKPANILFSRAGDVALTDFGIGSLLGATVSSGGSGFTPAFAPPEVLRELPATTASDVYALGLTLYTCLAGVNPFIRHDATPYAVLYRVVEEEPPHLGPEVDPHLDQLIHLMLAKDPVVRPAMMEAIGALQQIEERLGYEMTRPVFVGPETSRDSEVSATTPPPEGPVTPAAPGHRDDRTLPPAASRPASRDGIGSRLRIAAAAAVLVAIVGVGLILWLGDDSTEAREPGTTTTTALPRPSKEVTHPRVSPRSEELSGRFISPEVIASVTNPALRQLVGIPDATATPIPQSGPLLGIGLNRPLDPLPARTSFFFNFNKEDGDGPGCRSFDSERSTIDGYAGFIYGGATLPAFVTFSVYSFTETEAAAVFFSGRSLSLHPDGVTNECEAISPYSYRVEHRAFDLSLLSQGRFFDEANSWNWPASRSYPDYPLGGIGIILRDNRTIYEFQVRATPTSKTFTADEVMEFAKAILPPP